MRNHAIFIARGESADAEDMVTEYCRLPGVATFLIGAMEQLMAMMKWRNGDEGAKRAKKLRDSKWNTLGLEQSVDSQLGGNQKIKNGFYENWFAQGENRTEHADFCSI
jgi:hypothetical protein